MRITTAAGYDEPRDSLAQDWATFLADVLPEVAWVGIPNTGASATAFAEAWKLDALILTGGDDIGETPLRDETERALLSHFLDRGMPVFGVCRGMQLIHTEHDGELMPCERADHVATRHKIRLMDELNAFAEDGGSATVNSFHTQAIGDGDLPSGLICLATTEDGYVEAFKSDTAPLLGVMWHPEREAPASRMDRNLLRRHFGYSSDTERTAQ